MHKMVDGKRIELSTTEAKDILDYQAIVKAEEDAQVTAMRDKMNMKMSVLKKIQSNMGLTDDEIKTLF